MRIDASQFFRRSAALTLATWLCVASAQADFTDMIVFGDSLSDTGNAWAFTGFTTPPSPPYFNGRFSNGPIWVDILPGMLNVTLAPGQNYAVSGARAFFAVATNPPNLDMRNQVSQHIAAHPTANPDALYTMWIGANDCMAGHSVPSTTVNSTITSITNSITQLEATGARHFIVPNLPNLGMLPFHQGSGNEAALTAITDQFNAGLAVSLEDLRSSLDVDIVELDIHALFEDVLSNPAAYGLTNTNTSCYETGCPGPNTYLFWDALHPSAQAHGYIAQAAFDALQVESASPNWAAYE